MRPARRSAVIRNGRFPNRPYARINKPVIPGVNPDKGGLRNPGFVLSRVNDAAFARRGRIHALRA